MTPAKAKRLGWSLLASRFSAGVAFQILVLHGILRIFQNTGSPFMVGLVGLVLFLPNLFLLIGKPRVAVLKHSGQLHLLLQIGGTSAILAALVVPGSDAVVYGSAFVLSLLRVVRGPLFYVLMGALRDGGFGSGMAVRGMTLSWQLPLVIGPALVALLPGFESVLTVAVLFSVASLILAIPIAREQFHKPTESPIPAEDGIVIPWQQRTLLRPLLADGLVMGFLSFVTLLPFVFLNMGGGPSEVGWARAALNGGSLIVVLLLPRSAFAASQSGIFYSALLSSAVLVAMVPFANSSGVLLGICGLLGVLDGISVLYRDSLILNVVPAASRGEISVFNQVLVSASDELGEWRAGLFAEWWGIRSALLGGAGLAAILGFIFWRNQKEIGEAEAPMTTTIHQGG